MQWAILAVLVLILIVLNNIDQNIATIRRNRR